MGCLLQHPGIRLIGPDFISPDSGRHDLTVAIPCAQKDLIILIDDDKAQVVRSRDLGKLTGKVACIHSLPGDVFVQQFIGMNQRFLKLHKIEPLQEKTVGQHVGCQHQQHQADKNSRYLSGNRMLHTNSSVITHDRISDRHRLIHRFRRIVWQVDAAVRSVRLVDLTAEGAAPWGIMQSDPAVERHPEIDR